MREPRSNSMMSRVSSPGTPKIHSTPSFSKAETGGGGAFHGLHLSKLIRHHRPRRGRFCSA